MFYVKLYVHSLVDGLKVLNVDLKKGSLVSLPWMIK